MKKRYGAGRKTITKCALCGEEIHLYLYHDYAYKFEEKYFCKYSCLQKYKRQHGEFLYTEKIEKTIENYDEKAEQKIQQQKLIEKMEKQMQKRREYLENRKQKKLGEKKK